MIDGDQKELLRLKAKALALQNRLIDIQQQRDRGLLDEGRYASLAGHLDEQRIGILLQVKDIIGGKDQTFSRVLDNAIDNAPYEEVRNELVNVAIKKGLGEEIKEELKKHRGGFISLLIDVAMAAVKVTV
jgi:hypothetical protein